MLRASKGDDGAPGHDPRVRVLRSNPVTPSAEKGEYNEARGEPQEASDHEDDQSSRQVRSVVGQVHPVQSSRAPTDRPISPDRWGLR